LQTFNNAQCERGQLSFTRVPQEIVFIEITIVRVEWSEPSQVLKETADTRASAPEIANSKKTQGARIIF
jgi:hypothetical protein